MTSQIKVKNIKKQNNNYDHNQIFKQMFTSQSVNALKISFKKALEQGTLFLGQHYLHYSGWHFLQCKHSLQYIFIVQGHHVKPSPRKTFHDLGDKVESVKHTIISNVDAIKFNIHIKTKIKQWPGSNILIPKYLGFDANLIFLR